VPGFSDAAGEADEADDAPATETVVEKTGEEKLSFRTAVDTDEKSEAAREEPSSSRRVNPARAGVTVN
jgi:hypothetical protein